MSSHIIYILALEGFSYVVSMQDDHDEREQ
jgi:hypothetical protein